MIQNGGIRRELSADRREEKRSSCASGKRVADPERESVEREGRRIPPSRYFMKKTHSSGGVVLNSKGQVLVVSQNGNSWSLPKGHLDPGETALEAAQREIYEESGVSSLELVRDLGSYERYKIGLKEGQEDRSELKIIHLFLFKTDQMVLNPMDPKHPEARWVDKKDVAALLTHPKDKAFFSRIVHEL
jgi:8-oxo-dGTP pyrophosphatase MutT (NUDIX family)